MTWAQARGEFTRVLTEAKYTVYRIPPISADLPLDLFVSLRPPARSTVRRKGDRRIKTYRLEIALMHPLGDESDVVTESDAVDDAAEKIDDLMETHITLGGRASAVAPIEWGAAEVSDHPEGSGIYYVKMFGTMQVQLDLQHARGAGYPDGDSQL